MFQNLTPPVSDAKISSIFGKGYCYTFIKIRHTISHKQSFSSPVSYVRLPVMLDFEILCPVTGFNVLLKSLHVCTVPLAIMTVIQWVLPILYYQHD